MVYARIVNDLRIKLFDIIISTKILWCIEESLGVIMCKMSAIFVKSWRSLLFPWLNIRREIEEI